VRQVVGVPAKMDGNKIGAGGVWLTCGAVTHKLFAIGKVRCCGVYGLGRWQV